MAERMLLEIFFRDRGIALALRIDDTLPLIDDVGRHMPLAEEMGGHFKAHVITDGAEVVGQVANFRIVEPLGGAPGLRHTMLLGIQARLHAGARRCAGGAAHVVVVKRDAVIDKVLSRRQVLAPKALHGGIIAFLRWRRAFLIGHNNQEIHGPRCRLCRLGRRRQRGQWPRVARALERTWP